RLPQVTTFQGCKTKADGHIQVDLQARDTTHYTFTWFDSSHHFIRSSVINTSDSLSRLLPGTYYLNITTTVGCDTTIQIILTPKDYQLALSTDTLICQGQSASFLNRSDNYTTYYWQFGDGDTTTSTQQQLSHIYNTPGNYQIILTGIPCFDTVMHTIVVDTT